MWVETIKNKFLKTMGIKISEQPKVLWTLILSFLAGTVLCYISSLPLALFLTNYGSEQLPQIYLAVAFVSMGFGFVYAFFERRQPFNKLIIGLAFILSVVLTLLGTALIALNSKWIILILLIWAVMAYDLIEFCLWSVLNRIYTMQQAKNSFGIIGGCQSLGGLTGGVLSPFLVSWMGLNNLIAATGFLALLMVFVMLTLVNKTTVVVEEETTEEESDNIEEKNSNNFSFKSILRNKYILKIFALSSICIIAMYIVDLLFNTAAEARYTNEEELAGFLGVFFGLVDGIDLLCSMTIFGWLLKRLGIILTLFVLPTIGVLLSLPIIIFSNIPLLANVVFWLIVTLKLLEESLRGSLTDMSNLLLLQPFPVDTRSFVQSKIDSIVIGFSTALVSIILIVISETIGPSILVLGLLALIFFSLSMIVLSTLKADYVQAVGKAIASRFFERNLTLSFSKEDLILLQKYLFSPHPDEVIYALHAIEEVDRKEFSSSLKTVLHSSKNSTIHQYIIYKIKYHKLLSYYPTLIKFLNNESEELVIQALKSASYLNYQPIRERVKALSTSSSLQLSSTALVILLKKETDQVIKDQALRRVEEMAQSEDPKQRAMAAYIISKVPTGLEHLLEKLSEDKDSEVRSTVFLSVLKLKKEDMYDDLLRNLSYISITPKFVEAFKRQIEILQPLLTQQLDKFSPQTKTKVLNILRQFKAEISKPFIEQCALTDNFNIRQTALNTLTYFKKPFSSKFLEALDKQILDEVAFIKAQHEYRLVIPNVEITKLLYSVISLKQQRALERLMLALSIYYDHKTMYKALKGLKSSNEEERGYAIELIDTSLESAHKKHIPPLLIDIYLTEHNEVASLNSIEFINMLKSNLAHIANDDMNNLTCIASAYIVKLASINECFKEVEALRTLKISLIQETMHWLDQKITGGKTYE